VKRAVFERPDGVKQILGWFPVVPGTIQGLTTGGVEYPLITLVRVDTRAAYYRAPLVPTSAQPQTFNPAQR
jgi:hypothetical protein